MSGQQRAHAVAMANQIAANLAIFGDEAPTRVADHLRRFWSPALLAELVDARRAGIDMSPLVAAALDITDSPPT